MLEIAEIGMPRTGTRSLAEAARMLGFSAFHGVKDCRYNIAGINKKIMQGRCDLPMYQHSQYVGNLPYVHWRQLAEGRPDLKFILTVRDIEPWLDSCARRWGTVRRRRAKAYAPGGLNEHDVLRVLVSMQLFGMVGFSRELWRAAYERHVAAIRAEIPSDRLLVFNARDGWQPVCEFLDRPQPAIPYPCIRKTVRR